MFKSIIAVIMLSSAQGFAGVSDITPTTDAIIPSLIEQVIVLQKESGQSMAIRFVQVDNGGSSDSPRRSRYYLSFHRDGEMFDVDGSYLVLDEASDLKVSKLSLSAGIFDISYIQTVDEEGRKTARVSSRLNISEVLKEVKAAKSANEDEIYKLKSAIGFQNIKP
ncbi:MAG: hypothetical protein H7328_12390 [Bdellovibrio sp.]|nr:hypothetical protein [Bdellovibrio sp.]